MAGAVLAAFAVVAGCYAASAVVLPSVAALFLALLVAPIAGWLTRRGLGRGGASLIAVSCALAAILLLGFAAYRAVANVAQQVPRYEAELRHAAAKAQARLLRFQRRTERLVPQGGATGEGVGPPEPAAASKGVGEWSAVLLRGLGSLVEAAGLAVFVPFLALFLLIEERPLCRALAAAAGPGFDAARLAEQVPRTARAYVYGNALLALGLAVVQGALFLSVGLDNALALGLVTGFLNVIPILGAPLAVGLPLLQGLGTFHGPVPYFLVGGVLSALHLVAANWIIPRWIGVHVRVNTTAAACGMLFFSWLWGLTGFLLAVPLTAFVKIALECSPRGARLAPLLAAEEPEA